MTEYRELAENEINRALFRQFIRRQNVTDCWRKVDGTWVVKSDPFVDDWSEADYQTLISCLRKTVATGGYVLAAFLDNALKGFVSVEPGLFGREHNYMDLSSIHVSQNMRGQGIGRSLFMAAAEWAAKNGAQKLYISAHSAVESQAFYRAMGCVEAREYQQEHVDKEPFDCQLEYSLTGEKEVLTDLINQEEMYYGRNHSGQYL